MGNNSMLELMVDASRKYIGVPIGYFAYYTALAISPVVRRERELVQGQLHEPFVADVQRLLYNISFYFNVDPIGKRRLKEVAQSHETQVAENHRIMAEIQRGVDSISRREK